MSMQLGDLHRGHILIHSSVLFYWGDQLVCSARGFPS